MMEKILYFDTETTGLDSKKNGIWQLAFVVEINGEVREKVDMKFRPMPGDEIEDSALEITGITRGELSNLRPANEAFRDFRGTLNNYINPYDKNDKFYPAGYNIPFDLNFMGDWFKKNGEKYGFGSYCNWRAIDPLPFIRFLHFSGKINLENYKLETVCNFLGIELKAHDAISDIMATREIILRLKKKLSLCWV